MPNSYSGVWSTLGYGALTYFWGVPSDEVDRLPEEDKRRLTALTNKVVQMPEAERRPILVRLEATPPPRLLPALQELAWELVP